MILKSEIGVNYIVSAIIDLKRLKQFLNNKQKLECFIYIYDSARNIDIMKGCNLGELQKYCKIFSRNLEKDDSNYKSFNNVCATMAAAKHPEIVEKIRNREIIPIPMEFSKSISKHLPLNYFEAHQIAKSMELLNKNQKTSSTDVLNQFLDEKIIDKIRRNILEGYANGLEFLRI